MKILMIGPDRKARGGITTVINQYYEAGLDRYVELNYLASTGFGSKWFKIIKFLSSYKNYKRNVRKYDIVHIHMASKGSYFRKRFYINYAKKCKRNVIIHLHGATFDSFYESLPPPLKKDVLHTFENADRVITLSENWKEKITNICDPNKITVIYNSISIPGEEYLNYESQNVLFMGTIGKRKGTFDLLNIWANVKKMVPEAQLFLGGDEGINIGKNLCTEKGISDSVHFLGWVTPEVREDYLKKCSVYVLPSYHEGMPMSVLEAMSHGLATISTNVGGIPLMIDDAKNGFLINAGDTCMLQNRLVQLLNNKKLREQIGKAGREKIIVKFNLNKVISQLLNEYEIILSK